MDAETTSKFGSGLFLLVQVVLLLDFVHRWNDTWVGYGEQFWLVLVIIIFLLYLFFVIICKPLIVLSRFHFCIFFNQFSCLYFTFWTLQVYCSICCFTCLLCGNIFLLGTSLPFLYSIWTWLWAQHLLYCYDPDSSFCFCNSGSASSSKFLISQPVIIAKYFQFD